MNAKTGTTGFYREDAARLASEAARLPQQPLDAPQEPATKPPRAAPAIVLDEPNRPPLAPEPATNQNERLSPPPDDDFELGEVRRPWSVGRAVAWVLLAPWYAVTLVAAVGLVVLFVRFVLRV